MSKKTKIIIVVSVVSLLVAFSLFIFLRSSKENDKKEEIGQEQEVTNKEPEDKNGAVFCTQDVIKCPDGSYVGRTLPDCNFAPCPISKELKKQ